MNGPSPSLLLRTVPDLDGNQMLRWIPWVPYMLCMPAVLIWQACITYDVESNRIKRLIENELGIPYLGIETDYSPSDSARIGVRVEALLETVRARRTAGVCGS